MADEAAEKNGDVADEATADDQTTVDEVSESDAKDEPEDQRAPYVHDPEIHGRDFRVEGNDVRDYIGVDPEYMTYANPGDAPILTDTERFRFTNQYDHLDGNYEEDLAKEGVPADELEAGEVEGGETETVVPESSTEEQHNEPAKPVDQLPPLA